MYCDQVSDDINVRGERTYEDPGAVDAVVHSGVVQRGITSE